MMRTVFKDEWKCESERERKKDHYNDESYYSGKKKWTNDGGWLEREKKNGQRFPHHSILWGQYTLMKVLFILNARLDWTNKISWSWIMIRKM